ncbi:hypothetical protein J6590_013701 [Homalodisca vitripennis]|nr:hypothetical protein J6590_013701 [Homalodisca vitripennis]
MYATARPVIVSLGGSIHYDQRSTTRDMSPPRVVARCTQDQYSISYVFVVGRTALLTCSPTYSARTE